jgi:tellurite resistance protein TerC
MALSRHEELEPEQNPVLRFFRRMMPVTEKYEGAKFFIRRAGVLMATPLFLVLLVVESTDLVFAIDSIPAIFAVTQDPFIVYTSNVFAILGLRALYFLLADVMEKFQYLKLGLSFVLAFIGVKMILSDIYPIPTVISLLVVASILAISVLASLWKARTAPADLKIHE